MNTHPYLRAYLAGIFVPTFVLPLLLTFVVARLVFQVPIPVEQALIFPMAVVPLLWGLWNMLWLWSAPRTHVPIGLHGAVLPLLLMPLGATLATCLGILAIGSHGVTWFQIAHVPYTLIAPLFLAAMAGYYLVWKYVVGFLNRVLGIA
ncbi:MAG: hypothetical protein P4L26_05480, partial [Terracidiphilus sp.]|nr:hypothetical protein [Terracidiphilus sp.]